MTKTTKKEYTSTYIKDLFQIMDEKFEKDKKLAHHKITEIDDTLKIVKNQSQQNNSAVPHVSIICDALKEKRQKLLQQINEDSAEAKNKSLYKTISDMEKMVREHTVSYFNNHLSTRFDKLFITPFNLNALACIKELSRVSSKELKKIDQVREKLLNNLEKDSHIISITDDQQKQNIISSLVSIEIEKQKQHYFNHLDTILTGYSFSPAILLNANNDYPFKEKREDLANQCILSAKEELNHYKDFSSDEFIDIDMFDLCLSDAKNHYVLGKEILDGVPQKIDDASSMDTNNREGLSEDVWQFCSEDIFQKEVYHKQKLSQESNTRKPLKMK